MGMQKTKVMDVDGNMVTVVEPDEDGNFYGVVNSTIGYKISIGASLPFSKDMAYEMAKQAQLVKEQVLMDEEIMKLAKLEAQFDHQRTDPDLVNKYYWQIKNRLKQEEQQSIEAESHFANEFVVLNEYEEREV